jgi:hypothetical protein
VKTLCIIQNFTLCFFAVIHRKGGERGGGDQETTGQNRSKKGGAVARNAPAASEKARLTHPRPKLWVCLDEREKGLDIFKENPITHPNPPLALSKYRGRSHL